MRSGTWRLGSCARFGAEWSQDKSAGVSWDGIAKDEDEEAEVGRNVDGTGLVGEVG